MTRFGLVAVAAIMLAACSPAASPPSPSPSPSPVGHTIGGTFDLLASTGAPNTVSVSGCEGNGGYADIVAGANVTVKDGSGTIIGMASLAPGTGTGTHCTFAFSVPNVPETAFYSIEVSHRGALNYSLADMQSRAWTVALKLGSQ